MPISVAPKTVLLATCAWLSGCAATPPRDAQPQESQVPMRTAPLAIGQPESYPAATSSTRGSALTPMDEDEAARLAIGRATLRGVRFTSDTGDYQSVVRLVRSITDVPVLITPAARQVIADEALVLELDVRSPLSITSLLDLMTDDSNDLDWTIRNGVIEIGTTAQTRGEAVLQTHDVRDLAFARTEFLPPVIRGIPSGEPTESPRAGGEGDEKLAAIEPDRLVELVRTAVRPNYWDTEGGGTIEFIDSGYLLITATPVIHREVVALLNAQR